MAQQVTVYDGGLIVTVVAGDPPVDQSAEVASLTAQVATLTAELAAANTKITNAQAALA